MSITTSFTTVRKPSPQQVSVNIHGHRKSYLGPPLPCPHTLKLGGWRATLSAYPSLSWSCCWGSSYYSPTFLGWHLPLSQAPGTVASPAPTQSGSTLCPSLSSGASILGTCPKVSRNLLILRVQHTGCLGEWIVNPSKYKIKDDI